MSFKKQLFAICIAALTPAMIYADISLDNWNVDDFSDVGGVDSWGINVSGLSAIGPVTLTNAGTGESLSFSSIAGTIGGALSADAVFADTNGGDRVGIDNVSSGDDDDNDFDMGEGILFTFASNAKLIDINLNGMNDEERAFVFINGVHEYSLLDNSDLGSYPGININSPGDDDFVVDWDFVSGDTLEFRMNGDIGTENGFKVDTLTFSAIPEPSGLVVLGMFSLSMLASRRRN